MWYEDEIRYGKTILTNSAGEEFLVMKSVEGEHIGHLNFDKILVKNLKTGEIKEFPLGNAQLLLDIKRR